MARIDQLLKIMMEREASDLHLTTGFKPYIREHGVMVTVDQCPILNEELNRDIIYEITPELKRKQFEEIYDTDFAYELEGVGRFRVNVFDDNHGIGAVLRLIPSVIPSFEQLGLPATVRRFCYLSKGLVVVTGPTGSGKSTTLAAMMNLINRERTEHVITIEDPIEFVHTPIKCLINQREIHRHTKSYANALRAALREDPDIVLVGEMRDLETIEIAIETAETGHLVFGTLHTTTAASTVDRIIDKFPADRQNQIRTMLADSLKGVIAQTLCKKRKGGRCAVIEVLVVTTGVAANIREGKTHHIPAAIQMGRHSGMQNFTDELMRMVRDGIVSPKEAYIKAIEKELLVRKMKEGGFKLDLEMDDRGPDHEGMIQECEQMLTSDPNNLEALNNLAWIRASSVIDEFRNGMEAVKLAERANKLTHGKDPAVLDTLSAAYAEVGNFRRAIDTAQKARKLAESQGRQDLVGNLENQIEMFQANQPCRE